MGRKSTRINKSLYQLAREKKGYTRQEAVEMSEQYFSEGRLEKLESQKLEIHPDEVVKMAELYGDNELCAQYCAKHCAIGKKRKFQEVEMKDLSQIVLEVLSSLNHLNEEKERFIEMSVDGKIDDHEKEDFLYLRDQLFLLRGTIDSFSLWVDEQLNLQNVTK